MVKSDFCLVSDGNNLQLMAENLSVDSQERLLVSSSGK